MVHYFGFLLVMEKMNRFKLGIRIPHFEESADRDRDRNPSR